MPSGVLHEHSSQSQQVEGEVVVSIPFYTLDKICVGGAFVGATCGARSIMAMAV